MATLTHFCADDGELIHLAIEGHGAPPVVMLHGWTSSHQEWFPFMETLAAHHRVFRWDARGHGGHRLMSGNLPTVQRMARDLANLLDHYRLDQAVLVGHSMGALTTWEYIRAYGTARLANVCLIDQSPKLMTDHGWAHGIYGDFGAQRAADFEQELERDFAEGVLRLAAYGLNRRAQDKYQENARGWQKMREQLRALDPVPLIECWRSLTKADYRDVLGRIDVPAMLVFGAESNFYGPDTARYVHDSLPEAVLHVYEGTDHSPHQWQRERFARDLLAFIETG